MAAACTWSLASPAAAAVPGSLFFEGTLSGPQENMTGTVTVVADLYDAATQGVRVWTMTEPTQRVVDGRFVLELRNPAGTPSLVELFDGQPLWLQLTINGDVLSPRAPVGSVPYALRAGAVTFAEVEDVPESLRDGDDDTRYAPGNGLSLQETTFSLDTAWLALFLAAAPVTAASLVVTGAATFSGPVTVPEPTAASHAATRGYVDMRTCTWGAARSAPCDAPQASCTTTYGVTRTFRALTCGGTTVEVLTDARQCSVNWNSGC